MDSLYFLRPHKRTILELVIHLENYFDLAELETFHQHSQFPYS